MNIDLLEKSIRFNGKELLDLILIETTKNSQSTCDSPKSEEKCEKIEDTDQSSTDQLNILSKQIGERYLEKKILKFISSKSDYLFSEKFFNNTDQEEKDIEIIEPECNEKSNEPECVYVDLPPIETFMDISLKNKKSHFFNHLQPGDVIIAKIEDIKDNGICMQMLCFDNNKRRDLSRLRINVVCPIENAAQSNEKQNQANINNILSKIKSIYLINDLVRCVITQFDQTNDICQASLCQIPSLEKFNLPNDIKLGLILPEELPLHYQNIELYEKEPFLYNKKLKRQRAFNNPAYVDLLRKNMGLNKASCFSLMKDIHAIQIDKKEMASELYKQQNKSLALQSVQRGVNLFREGKNQDAMLCYNKALSIDENNVEAFVARGALYANDGDFNNSILDLKRALEFDTSHVNAKNYLKEVYIAYAVKLEKSESYDDALVYLKKALDVSPNNELIIGKINELTKKITDSYNKNRYGPSLPSKANHKSKSPSNSNGSSSYSNEKHNKYSTREKSNSSSSSSLNRSRSNDKHDRQSRDRYSNEYKKLDYKRNSSVTDGSYSSSKPAKNANSDDDEKDDDEDLEEFYNKLKRNKSCKK